MKLPIYPAKPTADRRKERLILLLSYLLSEKLQSQRTNLHSDHVALTDNEEAELRALVKEILSDREFFAALTFVDGLIRANGMGLDQLRELYLSRRAERGYSRIASSSTWYQFITRLGVPGRDLSTFVRAARPMPFDHFLRMESRLLSHFNVPLSAHDHMIRSISGQRANIEEIRSSIATTQKPHSSEFGILRATKRILESLGNRTKTLSANQVTGLTVVIANVTVLFTTRDWGVSGTISTIGGGLVMSVNG